MNSCPPDILKCYKCGYVYEYSLELNDEMPDCPKCYSDDYCIIQRGDTR